MRIAVASGKGGTGKTTVATSMAWVTSRNGQSVAYLDCDVEEPNGRIFLKPEITHNRSVRIKVPQVNEAACTLCGKCGEICQYSAIVCLGRKVLVFPELCHGCGGCSLVCPDTAITEVARDVGILETGWAGQVQFVQGTLNVGEAKGPPVIRAVRAAAPDVDVIVMDAPPGTSCPVIESIRGCDFVVLVTEPTPFGLNDFKLAVDMVRALRLPFGVVINRADLGDRSVHRYCRKEGITILAEIRDDRSVAEAYSRGELVPQALPAYEELFMQLLRAVFAQVTVSTSM
jgi:MinD superfamily P-loop ATPase